MPIKRRKQMEKVRNMTHADKMLKINKKVIRSNVREYKKITFLFPRERLDVLMEHFLREEVLYDWLFNVIENEVLSRRYRK